MRVFDRLATPPHLQYTSGIAYARFGRCLTAYSLSQSMVIVGGVLFCGPRLMSTTTDHHFVVGEGPLLQLADGVMRFVDVRIGNANGDSNGGLIYVLQPVVCVSQRVIDDDEKA